MDMKVTETGGTSINGQATPGVKWLVKKRFLSPGQTIADFGSGKYLRNTKWLRENGFTVFAYDPYHGWDCDGFGSDSISKTFPWDYLTSFDSILSTYVLNVVSLEDEENIIDMLSERPNFHIVRNDIPNIIGEKIAKGDGFVYDRLYEVVGTKSRYTEDDFMKLARYGIPTTRGFQRHCELEKYGFTCLKKTTSYKIYQGPNV